MTRLFPGQTTQVCRLTVATVREKAAASRGEAAEAAVSDPPPPGVADEQTILCTPNHPFRTSAGGGAWVQAEALLPGERLVGSRAEVLEVRRVEVRAEAAQIYNFEVDGFHTYYVAAKEGRPAVWVHNMCAANAADAVPKLLTHDRSLGQDVIDLANDIMRAYPGHVTGLNQVVRNAAGNVITDLDIVTRNAVIQMKARQTGLTRQVRLSKEALDVLRAKDKVVIAYAPNLKKFVSRGVNEAGGLATSDRRLLLDILKP